MTAAPVDPTGRARDQRADSARGRCRRRRRRPPRFWRRRERARRTTQQQQRARRGTVRVDCRWRGHDRRRHNNPPALAVLVAMIVVWVDKLRRGHRHRQCSARQRPCGRAGRRACWMERGRRSGVVPIPLHRRHRRRPSRNWPRSSIGGPASGLSPRMRRAPRGNCSISWNNNNSHHNRNYNNRSNHHHKNSSNRRCCCCRC